MSVDTTLCITAGGRPDLLNETLASLLPHNGQFFDHILITNDRGDEAPNEVVRNLAPTATLLNHETPIGQHPSIDEMYERVVTEFIFHCEDDWFFDPVPFIPTMLSALIDLPNVSSVSARQTCSLRAHDGRSRKFGPTIAVEGGFARRSGSTIGSGTVSTPPCSARVFGEKSARSPSSRPRNKSIMRSKQPASREHSLRQACIFTSVTDDTSRP